MEARWLDLPFPCFVNNNIVNNKTLKKPRFINDKRMNERLKVESGCILIMTCETSWVRLEALPHNNQARVQQNNKSSQNTI
jgi:hypothetical protein